MNKIQIMKEAPIPKALLTLGIPTMIGMLISALYNIVDAYFVGGLGTQQLAAISVSFPIGQAMVAFGLLFGSGAASYIPRLLGKGDHKAADRIASITIYSSLFVGIILTILSLLFLEPLLTVLGATESIMGYSKEYAQIFICAAILNIFSVTMTNIVTSEGAAKISMLAMLLGAVSNIILDPIFIYQFNLGIAGAAIATAISQGISSLIFLIYILRRKSVFSFSFKKFSFDKSGYKEILKIGIPTLVFQLLASLSISLTNLSASQFGDAAIAAMGTVTRVISLGTLVVFGFTKGFQPIAGYNYGAKNIGRLSEAVKITVIWTTGFCLVLGMFYAIFPTAIISLFTKDDFEVLKIGSKALRIGGLSFMIFGFYTTYSPLFLALGKAKEGAILGILRQGIFFIPAIFLLPHFFGINGVIYAQSLIDLVVTFITVAMAVHLHKSLSSMKLAASVTL